MVAGTRRAMSLLLTPWLASSTLRARAASACAVLGRRLQALSCASSLGLIANGFKRGPGGIGSLLLYPMRQTYYLCNYFRLGILATKTRTLTPRTKTCPRGPRETPRGWGTQ